MAPVAKSGGRGVHQFGGFRSAEKFVLHWTFPFSIDSGFPQCIQYARLSAGSKRKAHVLCVRMENVNSWEKVFGVRIREMRQLRGWTQEELARRMAEVGFQMHQTTVAKLENGTRPTNVGEIAALAALLEVPIGALFGTADHAEKQREVQTLQFRLKGLEAESEAIFEKRAELDMRMSQLAHEMDEVRADYEKAQAGYKAAFGSIRDADGLVILGAETVEVAHDSKA